VPDPALNYQTGTITWQAIAGQDELDHFEQSGGASGGTFTLYLVELANNVGPVNYNDNIAAIQALFDTAVSAGNSVVSGTDATSFDVEFKVTDRLQPVTVTLSDNSLTGGASPTVQITRTQVGRPDQIVPLFEFRDVNGHILARLIPNSGAHQSNFYVQDSNNGDYFVQLLAADNSATNKRSAVFLGSNDGSITGLVDGSAGAVTLTLAAFAAQTAALLDLQTSTGAHALQATSLGALDFLEQAAPGAPAVETARLYSRDNGADKTQLVVVFPSGAVQVIATEP
jgi:hypothetical protein